jgi:hypothetical protein
MALTKGDFRIAPETSGSDWRTFADGSGKLNQGVALVDEAGDHRVEDHSLLVIDRDHYELHEGESYVITRVASIGSGNNGDIWIAVGAVMAHAYITVVGQAETSFTLHEAGTYSGGTSLSVINRNRSSVNSSTVTAVYTPTVSDVGTELYNLRFGSGKAVGGETRGTSEWVLAQSTDYLLRVTNQSVSSQYISVQIDFYEHDV